MLLCQPDNRRFPRSDSTDSSLIRRNHVAVLFLVNAIRATPSVYTGEEPDPHFSTAEPVFWENHAQNLARVRVYRSLRHFRRNNKSPITINGDRESKREPNIFLDDFIANKSTLFYGTVWGSLN